MIQINNVFTKIASFFLFGPSSSAKVINAIHRHRNFNTRHVPFLLKRKSSLFPSSSSSHSCHHLCILLFHFLYTLNNLLMHFSLFNSISSLTLTQKNCHSLKET